MDLPLTRRQSIVIPDCENDTISVQASLRFVGLTNKKGELKEKARGAHIVQTGDLLHKQAPNPAVVRFWEELGSAVETMDGALHLVAGNHELEVWQRLQAGERLGLKRRERRMMLDWIRSTRLFHLDGSILFIHGYPTVRLLRHMQAYRIRTGEKLDNYNRDCFQEAFKDPKRLARYAYRRGCVSRNCLLHDVQNPARYYRRHGLEVAELLSSFGIDLVVHGHRPERSGVQTDYELGRWLPGIRMINTDVRLRLQGLGATVISQTAGGRTDVFFVNKKNATSSYKKEIRQLRPIFDVPAAAPEPLPSLRCLAQ